MPIAGVGHCDLTSYPNSDDVIPGSNVRLEAGQRVLQPTGEGRNGLVQPSGHLPRFGEHGGANEAAGQGDQAISFHTEPSGAWVACRPDIGFLEQQKGSDGKEVRRECEDRRAYLAFFGM